MMKNTASELAMGGLSICWSVPVSSNCLPAPAAPDSKPGAVDKVMSGLAAVDNAKDVIVVVAHFLVAKQEGAVRLARQFGWMDEGEIHELINASLRTRKHQASHAQLTVHFLAGKGAVQVRVLARVGSRCRCGLGRRRRLYLLGGRKGG